MTPVPTWFQYAKPLLDAQVPDSVYDAQREQYFATVVRPAMMREGKNLDVAHEEFMKASERPGKSSAPRTELVAKAALEGLGAPIAGALGARDVQKGLSNLTRNAAREAERQGINPRWYEVGGEMLGQAPYWVGAFAAAGPLAAETVPAISAETGLSAIASRAAFNAAVGATVQGTYDAAKADDGHRLQEGLRGALVGGATVGAFEALGPLRRALMSKNGLSSEAATAVEATAKGTSSEMQEALASNAVQNQPAVTQTVQQWVAEQLQAAKRAGLPKDASLVEPGGRVKIQLKTAEGKIYNVGGVTGVDISNIGTLVDRIAPHLDAGGEIVSVTADPIVLNNFYSHLEAVNRTRKIIPEEVPAPTKGDLAAKGAAAESGPVGRTVETPSSPGGKPTPSAGPDVVQWDGAEWKPLEGSPGWWTTTDGRTLPEKALMAKAGDEMLSQGAKAAFSRRELLKRLGIASAGELVPKAEALSIAAEAGNKGAADELKTVMNMLNRALETVGEDYSIVGRVDDQFLIRGAEEGTTYVRGAEELANFIAMGGAEGSLGNVFSHIQNWDHLSAPVRKAVVQEIKESNIGQLLSDLQLSDNYSIWVYGEGQKSVDEVLTKLDTIIPNSAKTLRSALEMPIDELQFIRTKLPEAIKNPERLQREVRTYQEQYRVKEKRLDETRDQRYVDRAKKTRLAQQTVTPGTELARTPAMLGEEGTGGMMMRFARSARETQNRAIAAAPEMRSAERPLGDRLVVNSLENDITAYTKVREGLKPFYVFSKGETDPSTIFHETLHGSLGNLGLTQDLKLLPQIDREWKKQMYSMSSAWPREIQASYMREGAVGEEVYAYAASAVRTNDDAMLQAFAEADAGREKVLKWTAETTDTLLESTAKLPDSIHRRVLERKLGEVLRRSTNELRALKRDTADVFGADVDILNGKYVVRTPEGTIHHFNERPEVVEFLEHRYQEPLMAPNLVDESVLPVNVPRYARTIPPHSIGRPPVQTPPPTLEAPGAEQAGASLLSFFVRPFYPWLDSVSRKLGRPDLYEAFKALDTGITARDSMIEKFEAPLKTALVGKSLVETKYVPARQQDLYKFFQGVGPNRDFARRQLSITPAEEADLAALEKEFIEPLAAQSGLDLRNYLREVAPVVRRTGDIEAVKPTLSLTQHEVDFWKAALYKGEMDPNDTNLLRVAHSYLRLVARDQHIGYQLTEARKLINEKVGDTGLYRVGSLRPLLERQLDYIAGRPDYTQRVVDGAVQGAINIINSGIEIVNKGLPSKLHIEPIEELPRDAMGRWILFSYAGGLALRPMVPIRDSLQLLMTTYPMLGGKYLRTGMAKAYPVLKEGTEADAWKTADAYGALMKVSDLQNIYSGGYEQLAGKSGVTGKLTQFAEAALKPLQWSNNSNRLISFWGHAEKMMDALRRNVPAQNQKGLIKDGGLFWLDDTLRDKIAQEAMGANANQWQDIAFRAAKELTDINQWNYRRGASPGIYKYAMGRLFGQYGTWPLNYIEYARRLATKGDPGDKLAALTRLVIAHGAVLKSGEALGIDTGQWVFTQPMAYGGSPLFQAVVNVPNTLDFESYRGADARREVKRIFWPMEIPGGLAAERIYKAISSNSPTALQEALGFQPLKAGEEAKGYHQLLP